MSVVSSFLASATRASSGGFPASRRRRWNRARSVSERAVASAAMSSACRTRFLLADRDKLVAAAKAGKMPALGVGGWFDPDCQVLAKLGEHARIDRVGFRPPAGRLREVPRLRWIDAGVPHVGMPERRAQHRVVAAGGLHHDQAVAPCRPFHADRIAGVGDPAHRTILRVVNVEMILGDIDSERVRVSCHDACPRNARSVVQPRATVQVVQCGRGTEPDYGMLTARGPTVSRPLPSCMAQFSHTGPSYGTARDWAPGSAGEAYVFA